MGDPANPESSALSIRSSLSARSTGSGGGPEAAAGRRDGALEAALERLEAGRVSVTRTETRPSREAHLPLERPDTPDLHVTAVRRLPAMAAQYAPFPAALDPRLLRAFAARGIEQLYTHQAD